MEKWRGAAKGMRAREHNVLTTSGDSSFSDNCLNVQSINAKKEARALTVKGGKTMSGRRGVTRKRGGRLLQVITAN